MYLYGEIRTRLIQSNKATATRALPITNHIRGVGDTSKNLPTIADAKLQSVSVTANGHTIAAARFAFVAAGQSPRIACDQAVVAPQVGHCQPVQR